MTKRFEFHSNSRGVDEIKDLLISIDFQAQKHGVVTPVQYYTSMVKKNIMGSTKRTYHKERSFGSNYCIFLKILFQFKNLYKELI